MSKNKKIKQKDTNININKKRISTESIPSQRKNPLFCFHFLDKNNGLEQCTKDEKCALIEKLQKLSQLTWQEIKNTPKHGLGSEKIRREAFKVNPPNEFTDDEIFLALRFLGKAPMIGVRRGNVFHIIFIDRDFTVYNHS